MIPAAEGVLRKHCAFPAGGGSVMSHEIRTFIDRFGRVERSRLVLAILLTASGAFLGAGRSLSEPASPSPAGRWYKGNLHTHTLNSDGDSTPDEVVTWYREHGYQFLVLTDHNFLTSVDGLNALHGATDRFLVVPGEEVTDHMGDKPIHVNGLEVDRLVDPPGGASVVEMVQRMADAIRGAHGVPSINHPNFGWAITPDELGRIERARLLEVYNGHPLVNNLGGGGAPGLEETWDRILSSGRLLYGIAVDDAHHFKRPWDPAAAAPGRGWVYVRSPRLEGRALVDALERGDFYASTGVELSAVEATPTELTIVIREQPSSKYRIQFIGRQGRVLSESTSSPAVYRFMGDEGYVRAKVIESNGKLAWVQPVTIGRSAPR
jgi:hypothetical protein